MQMNKPLNFSSFSDYDYQSGDPDDNDNQSEAKISFDFNKHLQLDDISGSEQLLPDSEIHVDDEDREQFVDCETEEEEEEYEEEEVDDDDDFTFMYTGENNLPIYVDEAFEEGQIRPVFPLFDQKLLLGGDYDVEGGNKFPIRPPVEKFFIESPHSSPPSTAAEEEEIEGIAAGPFCSWSKESATGTSDLSKKSNSTGFSKLWRFRDKVHRSNSDGRDAFVFLNRSDRTTTASTSKPEAKRNTVDGSSVKVNAGDGKAKVVKKGTKVKKAQVSAHEVYLRSKGVQTEEERRRTYLPYRPEFMGFFTNVNGGLSRNVHPY